MNDQEILTALQKVDTPSITNVIATYPANPLCLGLYNPWQENWYTDQTIKCMYPELGARAGYAVTCVFGLPDPAYQRLTFGDVLRAMDATAKPTVLVLEQRFPPHLQGKVGLAGGIMTTALKQAGCVGVVSNGPSRDIDEIRPMEMQYLLSGITPGHGELSVWSVNTPVNVAGMSVAPGEIVHMDENGACKFPADKMETVLTNVQEMLKQEAELISQIRKAKTGAEIADTMAGHAYVNPQRD